MSAGTEDVSRSRASELTGTMTRFRLRLLRFRLGWSSSSSSSSSAAPSSPSTGGSSPPDSASPSSTSSAASSSSSPAFSSCLAAAACKTLQHQASSTYKIAHALGHAEVCAETAEAVCGMRLHPVKGFASQERVCYSCPACLGEAPPQGVHGVSTLPTCTALLLSQCAFI